MLFLANIRREAKLRQPVELRIRKINEIREEAKAGQRITAEQYEKALKPVTSELQKTQEVIRELTEMQQIPSTSPTMHSLSEFVSDDFVSSVLSKHNLQHPHVTFKDLAGISSKLGGIKANSTWDNKKKINKEIDVIRKYREFLRASEGTGLQHYTNASELIDRLAILLGQMRAGNDSVDVRNEAITILDKLLQEKKISQEDHQKLYEKIYSF